MDLEKKIMFSMVFIAIALFGVSGFALAAESSHIVSYTILEVAGISITGMSAFGSGVVNASGTILDTDATSTNIGLFTELSDPLVIENTGDINVSVDISTDTEAAAFIGGTSPSFKWKVSASSESGSCDNIGISTYTEATTVDQEVCDNLQWQDSFDSVDLDLQLTLPADAPPAGLSTTTLTVTAIAIP